MSEIYNLYYNKQEKELIIQPTKNNNRWFSKTTDEVTKWNEYYYLCNDRKKLREFAYDLKEQWIKETEEELRMLKELKI